MKELYKKLFEAKKEIGAISKDSTNPFFKSKYFDINTLLEHVEPILEKHGLLLLQPIEANQVKTKIIDIESGDCIASEMLLPELNDPQKLGSAITYYRRYTLQSLLGLQAEDDDANKASNNVKTYPKDNKPWLNTKSKDWTNITVAIEQGKLTNLDQITKFKVNKENQKLIQLLIDKIQ